jgi:hypothetical protein
VLKKRLTKKAEIRDFNSAAACFVFITSKFFGKKLKAKMIENIKTDTSTFTSQFNL